MLDELIETQDVIARNAEDVPQAQAIQPIKKNRSDGRHVRDCIVALCESLDRRALVMPMHFYLS